MGLQTRIQRIRSLIENDFGQEWSQWADRFGLEANAQFFWVKVSNDEFFYACKSIRSRGDGPMRYGGVTLTHRATRTSEGKWLADEDTRKWDSGWHVVDEDSLPQEAMDAFETYTAGGEWKRAKRALDMQDY